MYSEITFTSSLCVEDAILIIRENTNLHPDLLIGKAEQDKFLFVSHDKVHPSLKDIVPNMHVYSQRYSPITPVINIDFSSTGKSDQTLVKIKAKPDPQSISIWIFVIFLCFILALVQLAIAVSTKNYRYIFGFAFLILWIPFANWIGFWVPYNYVINDLMSLLKKCG